MKTILITALCALTSTALAQFGAGSTPPIFPVNYSHMYGVNDAGKIVTIGETFGVALAQDFFVPGGMDSPVDYPFVMPGDDLVYPEFILPDDSVTQTLEQNAINREISINEEIQNFYNCIDPIAPTDAELGVCVVDLSTILRSITDEVCMIVMCPTLFNELDNSSSQDGSDFDSECADPWLHQTCLSHPTLIVTPPAFNVDTTGVDPDIVAAVDQLMLKLKGVQYRFYNDLSDDTQSYTVTISNYKSYRAIAFAEFYTQVLLIND